MLSQKSKIEWSLLSLRLGVFIVMAIWSVDKLIKPEHASKVFEKFYMLENMSESIFYVLGAIQLLLVAAFVVGYKKRISYGAIFIMHFLSTILSWKAYLDMQMLFYAAWPMLAACFTLYILRDLDKKFTV